MTWTFLQTEVSPASARRKQEVRNRLAGLGPCRTLPGSAADDDSARGRMLAAALEELGPVFASFGLYMASRIDLLPGRMCEELARIPDVGRPGPRGFARDVIHRELGSSVADIQFEFFDEVPFESRLISQHHRARTVDGRAVEVRLVRPDVRDHHHDLQLLPLAADALGGTTAVDGAIEDFREDFLRRLDMRQEARALAALALGTKDADDLRVPVVYREACGPSVLTMESLPGIPFHEFLQGNGSHVGSRHIARLLCQVWLRLALMGDAFPTELPARDVTMLSTRQIALCGVSVNMAPAESREHLWNYLISVSAEDADGACAALLAQTVPSTRPPDQYRFRQRFRQIVPFRDGTWGSSSTDQAAHIFVQWREAIQQGCTLEPHMVAFFRGLFAVAETARRLSPGYDAIADALRDVRLISGVAQFGRIVDQRHLGEQIASMASLMLTMPRRMDSLLAVGSGDTPVKIQLSDGDGSTRRSNASAAVASLLMLLAAVVLLAHRFVPALLGPEVADRAVALLFVLLGAALLRTVSRI